MCALHNKTDVPVFWGLSLFRSKKERLQVADIVYFETGQAATGEAASCYGALIRGWQPYCPSPLHVTLECGSLGAGR